MVHGDPQAAPDIKKADMVGVLGHSVERGNITSIVGTFTWTLNKGESWILGPDSVFKMRDITRISLFREAYMLEENASWWTK